MPVTKHQLARALQTATHIADREQLAAFILDDATAFAGNPFPNLTAGAALQTWRTRAIEFEGAEIAWAGLGCLLRALERMQTREPLVQEILRTAPHTLYLFHRGDGCSIVGAVLHGKPRQPLPAAISPARAVRPKRSRGASRQLDLFDLSIA
ncbi:hypothetical protein [Methylobacterium nodulans]|uniref:Uncharacterized protein n=1 Tax=Methylobacterium nodulans (strain LMG 21967 / CNCM I-2342 / ORS 2060) TaxID=460265 RepID=B8IXU0_METNO|nr:hypothetical protein [Methylobacterium nodulans]ACL63230.1 conserved hypothetical protein [Methylobacterium nodulans ORS 2060]